MKQKLLVIKDFYNSIFRSIMSGIKLTYFNMTARGELSRLILAQARAEYEDCRIERAEWPALKKSNY